MVLKNMKIGKKLILSFVLMSLFASIGGFVSIGVMKTIESRYSTALVKYGFSQGDVGKLMAVFCRVDGNVHDAVSYQNHEDQVAAVENVSMYLSSMDALFNTVEDNLINQQAKESFEAAKAAWGDYQIKVNELLSNADSSNAAAVAVLQKRLVNELDPVSITIYTSLSSILDIKAADGIEESSLLKSFADQSIVISMLLVVTAIVLSTWVGVVISRGISRAIQACSDRLVRLAAGDITSPVPVIKSKDETGILASATETIVTGLTNVVKDVGFQLEEMGNGNFNVSTQAEESYVGDFAPLLQSVRVINNRLSETLLQINQSADQVSSGSDQLSGGAQELSQGATEQASSVQELAGTVAQISSQVQDNAENARQAREIVNRTGEELAVGNEKMQELISAMDAINNSSKEIGKIIKTIEDIAFQTNILALNAAVEAARAGSAGKGFAVVADEVRNLASKSAEAAKSTTTLIEESVKAVNEGTALADETAKALITVVEKAKAAADMVDKITSASGHQADSIMQVTQGVDQISAVVQTNSATAEQSAAASQELSSQAAMLRTLVGRFILKSQDIVLPKPEPKEEYANRPILHNHIKY